MPSSSWPQVVPRRVSGARALAALAAVIAFGAFVPVISSQAPVASKAPSAAASKLFDQDSVQVIKLTMKPKDWETLKKEYQSNEYYPADLAWKDKMVPTVGVRSRGHGSRSWVKPALRIDINRYVENQTFLQLKSFVLINALQDGSMMRQRVAMRFYARMNLPAPRVVHARLFVNDEYSGLYELIESVDKVMLGRLFDRKEDHTRENDGHLYEYTWHDNWLWTYLGADFAPYAERFEPKTHEQDAPADLYGPLEEMVRLFNTVRDSDLEAVANEYLDLAQLTAFLAVDNFLADADGFLGDWGINNFYLYRLEGSKRVVLIPWDKDLAFYDHRFELFRHVEDNVLTRRVLRIPSAYQSYVDALRRCAELSMRRETPEASIGWLEAEVRREMEQIRADAYADHLKTYQDEQFEKHVNDLIVFARERAPFVIAELDKRAAGPRRVGR